MIDVKPRSSAQVEWVVLYLAKSTNFESQLPEETQSKINEGPILLSAAEAEMVSNMAGESPKWMEVLYDRKITHQ